MCELHSHKDGCLIEISYSTAINSLINGVPIADKGERERRRRIDGLERFSERWLKAERHPKWRLDECRSFVVGQKSLLAPNVCTYLFVLLKKCHRDETLMENFERAKEIDFRDEILKSLEQEG